MPIKSRMHNLDQAEHILSWALRSRAQSLGTNHHNTLRTLYNIANVYHLQGRLEGSKSQNRRCETKTHRCGRSTRVLVKMYERATSKHTISVQMVDCREAVGKDLSKYRVSRKAVENACSRRASWIAQKLPRLLT